MVKHWLSKYSKNQFMIWFKNKIYVTLYNVIERDIEIILILTLCIRNFIIWAIHFKIFRVILPTCGIFQIEPGNFYIIFNFIWQKLLSLEGKDNEFAQSL